MSYSIDHGDSGMRDECKYCRGSGVDHHVSGCIDPCPVCRPDDAADSAASGVLLALASAALLAVVLLSTGCVVMEPTSMGVGAKHTSQPLRGMGPPPIGDHSASEEMNYEAIEGWLRWETPSTYFETNMDYVVHESNLTGGPWQFTVRAGWKTDL